MFNRRTKFGRNVGEWMSAPGFAVAFQQHVVVSLQKQQVRRDSGFLNVAQQPGQRLEIFPAVSRVDTYGDAACRVVSGFRYLVQQGAQQPGRHIVDTVVAQILEGVQRNRLAGTRESTDDY